MRVVCPNPDCRKPLTLPDGPAGAAYRCPSCGAPCRSGGEAPSAEPPAPSPAPTPPPQEGARGLPAAIGPYKVSRELGRGAFGIVYEASDPDLDRGVAIKVLNPKALESPTAGDRFLREARVVARMHHNHIVPVFQLGKHGDCPYIASLFIPGQTLADAIPEGGMEPGRAVELVLQLLDALAYAHAQNVVHRDIKPSNVLLDEGGHLFLTDFGLAGLVGQHQMTRAGSKLGTPSYMPPEQCEGKLELIGPASDQYSAGVVLYELLTNHLPFEGASLPALLYNVVHTPPPPPSEWRQGLDRRLDALCLRALAKKPEERFPDCRAFAEALKAWRASPAPQAPPAAAPRPQAGPRNGRRSSLVAQEVIPDALPAAKAPARPANSQRKRAPVTLEAMPVEVAEEAPPPDLPPSRRAWLWAAGGAAAAAVALAAGGGLWLALSRNTPATRRSGIRDLMDSAGDKKK